MTSGAGKIWPIAMLVVCGLLSVPVVTILASLLQSSGDVWQHLAATVLPEYVRNSLLLMLGVGVLVTVLGIVPAWLVTMYRFPGSGLLYWGLLLPLALPAYIIAYTYTGMLDFAGPVQSWLRQATGWQYGDYWFPEIRSLPGAMVMLSLVLYPYVYLLCRAAFLEQSVCVLEVSRTLGCGPLRTFSRVGLPLARPALIAGLSLALMETLADYGTVQYFGVSTLTTGIFRTWFGLGSGVAAAQLSALLMLFVLMVLVLEAWSRKTVRFHHTSTRYRKITQQNLSGGTGWFATLACVLPVIFGFLVPSVQLAVWAVQTHATTLTRDFYSLIAHSIELAALTAVIALIIALFVAYGKRLQRNIITHIAARMSALGYAIPGTVIAVGTLIPFAWLDRLLDGWSEDYLGRDLGLLFSGTIFVLVFAYIVRFLPVALNTADAALTKIKPSMYEAGRVMGLKPRHILQRVHLPMMRGSIMTALLLVFVDVMKELPATLILRPFNFNTLAIRTYELANEERLADASVPALAIVVAGLIPVIVLSRSISGSRPGHV